MEEGLEPPGREPAVPSAAGWRSLGSPPTPPSEVYSPAGTATPV